VHAHAIQTLYMAAALLCFCPAVKPWAGWFVIAAFAGILMWEQVWDLPGHAALSGAGCAATIFTK
jgi:hypothetical protein